MKKWKRYVLAGIALLFCAISPVHAQETQEYTIAERKEKASRLGLTDWVDDEGYLIQAFYEGKSDQLLSDMGVDGLVRTMTEEELKAYVERLNAGIHLYTVTRYEKVSQVNPATGSTLYTGIFEVDGRLAYCIERSVATPAKGSSTGNWIAVTNDNLRKVLYYGYNGPASKGYTYVETALAAGEANGDGDNSLGRNVLAEIKAYSSPPSEFKVWKVETNGGSTQDLAFYTVEEKGYIQLKKESGKSEITAENMQYSLTGAVYGVYSNLECTNKVGELTITETGYSEKLQLKASTYYIKELKAPQGYKLNSEIQTIKVSSSQTTVLTVLDYPKMFVPGLLVQKQDADTGLFKPQGIGSFRGAEFLVKYYSGDYEEKIDPCEQGIEPERQWVFKTDGNGAFYFNEEYLVSGDAIWKNENKECAIPFGTITFQEIKAPDGYLINPEIFVRRIGNDTTEIEKIIVPESMVDIELIIKKVDENGQPISGAEFTIYSDKECTNEIMKGITGEDGTLVIKGIIIKTYYYVLETKAPDGYEGDTEVYEIYPSNISDNTSLYLEVVNQKIVQLPNTGGYGIYHYLCLGSGICIITERKIRNNTRRSANGKESKKMDENSLCNVFASRNDCRAL